MATKAKQMRRRTQNESGAAAIEGLAGISVILLVLIAAMYISAGYYNLSLLNTAAQNIAISTQTQVDRYCPNQYSSGCATLGNKVVPVTSAIATEVSWSLLFSEKGKVKICPSASGSCFLPGTSAAAKPHICFPGRSAPLSLPTPADSNSPLSSGNWQGWGYTYVRLKAPFFVAPPTKDGFVVRQPGEQPFAWLGAQAMSFSYSQPKPSIGGACTY